MIERVGFLRAGLLVSIALIGPMSAASAQRAGKVVGATIPLQEAALGEALRPGYGVHGTIPKRGLFFEIRGQRHALVDLDGDGAIRADADGIAVDGHVFVVTLRYPWLCDLGQCQWRLEAGQALVLTPQNVGIDARLLGEAAEVNAIRLRAGLPLAIVDEKLSRDCEKHCEFLKLNGLTESWKSGMVHFENRKLPGYSVEGERAGWGAAIQTGATSYRDSVLGWSTTVWHAIAMLHPRLTHFGVAHKHRVAMFYGAIDDREELRAPVLHPPDGARLVPRLFALGTGEVPSPFADDPKLGAGSGHPLIVMLPPDWRESKLVRFSLTDDRGKTVEGRASTPTAPGNPKTPGNAGCAVFLPSKALSSNRVFRARLELAGHPPLDWSFSTGSK